MSRQPDDTGAPTGARLGHYIGRSGGTKHYNSWSLPNRPARGKETHEVVCGTCEQIVVVSIVDESTRNARRLAKLGAGALIGLIGVIMAIQVANTPSDPVTYQQPGYVVWGVFAWVAVVIAGICVFAFGFNETGVRLHIARGSAVTRGTFGHKIIR